MASLSDSFTSCDVNLLYFVIVSLKRFWSELRVFAIELFSSLFIVSEVLWFCRSFSTTPRFNKCDLNDVNWSSFGGDFCFFKSSVTLSIKLCDFDTVTLRACCALLLLHETLFDAPTVSIISLSCRVNSLRSDSIWIDESTPTKSPIWEATCCKPFNLSRFASRMWTSSWKKAKHMCNK